MHPLRPQQSIRQSPINNRTNPQRQQIQPRIPIQIIKLQDLLSSRNRTSPVRELLCGVAGKGDGTQGIWREIANGVTDGREVVHVCEEGGHIEGHDAGHELGDGEEDGGEVDGEAGVGEEGVEHNSQTLPTINNTKAIEEAHKKTSSPS